VNKEDLQDEAIQKKNIKRKGGSDPGECGIRASGIGRHACWGMGPTSNYDRRAMRGLPERCGQKNQGGSRWEKKVDIYPKCTGR